MRGQKPFQFLFRTGKIRLQPQRLAVMRRGLGETAKVGKRTGIVALCRREIRPHRDGVAEAACRIRPTGVLRKIDAKVELDVWVLRFERGGDLEMFQGFVSLAIGKQAYRKIKLALR